MLDEVSIGGVDRSHFVQVIPGLAGSKLIETNVGKIRKFGWLQGESELLVQKKFGCGGWI